MDEVNGKYIHSFDITIGMIMKGSGRLPVFDTKPIFIAFRHSDASRRMARARSGYNGRGKEVLFVNRRHSTRDKSIYLADLVLW